MCDCREKHTGRSDRGDPIIISAEVVKAEVPRIFVDQGHSVDIMFYKSFKELDYSGSDLTYFGMELKVCWKHYCDQRLFQNHI